MTALTSHSDAGVDLERQLHQFLRTVRRGLPSQRGIVFGVIILIGMVAFEVFNFSTTEFALGDLLGDLSFAGLSWATILALAFCSIDFAGIARLMTPHNTDDQPIEVWYLLAAWFLGATMNAMLTWWSVSLALINHQGLGNEVLGREALLSAVPVFIAGMVWLIRVLLIGTLTLAGRRLFRDGTANSNPTPSRSRPAPRGAGQPEPAPAAAAFSSRSDGSQVTGAPTSRTMQARGRR